MNVPLIDLPEMKPARMAPGRFITFEGIVSSGNSVYFKPCHFYVFPIVESCWKFKRTLKTVAHKAAIGFGNNQLDSRIYPQ